MGEWANDQPESLTVGDPLHGHVVLDSTGLHAFATDGVSIIFGVDTATGTVTISASPASVIPGSSVSGAVASATSASNVPAAGVTSGTLAGTVVVPGGNVSGSVASASTSTNLAGGGTAAGTTTISGQLIVGNPLAAHVVIGTDASGANGVRLYGSSLQTLIDLNISGTPTITGALIRTAATGKRAELSTSTLNSIQFFTGAGHPENFGGFFGADVINSGAANQQFFAEVAAPQITLPSVLMSATVDVYSESFDSSLPARVDLRAGHTGGVGTATWDGQSLTLVPGGTGGAAAFRARGTDVPTTYGLVSGWGVSTDTAWGGGMYVDDGNDVWYKIVDGVALASGDIRCNIAHPTAGPLVISAPFDHIGSTETPAGRTDIGKRVGIWTYQPINNTVSQSWGFINTLPTAKQFDCVTPTGARANIAVGQFDKLHFEMMVLTR